MGSRGNYLLVLVVAVVLGSAGGEIEDDGTTDDDECDSTIMGSRENYSSSCSSSWSVCWW
jgi:hypothetical protein